MGTAFAVYVKVIVVSDLGSGTRQQTSHAGNQSREQFLAHPRSRLRDMLRF
jgi:hypothetical protein